MKIFSSISVTVLICLLITGQVQSAPVIGVPETWNSGTMNGWTNAIGPTTPGAGADDVSVGAIGGNTAVRVMFGNQGVPVPESEIVYADAGSSGGSFAGDQNYSGQNILAGFSFYAADYTTSSNLSLFFWSSTSDRTWTYGLSGPASVGVWTSYSVAMSYSANWSSPGAGLAEFSTDLGDVDQIGIWLARTTDTGAQTFGLDDFGLSVPEPGTLIVLVASFLSLVMTFRQNLRKLIC